MTKSKTKKHQYLITVDEKVFKAFVRKCQDNEQSINARINLLIKKDVKEAIRG